MKDGIHIASGDYVAVRKMSAEIWVIRLSTKTVTKLPISGDVFALSPDGQFVLVLSSSSLTLMKVDTKTVQKSYTLESDITVSKMGWVNSMVAWLATSEGIQLWDVDPSALLRLPVLFCLLFISINSFFQHKLLIIGPYHRAY